ncbi:uncharacterized protein LOC101733901 [Xenopus tropicalis]|uniref:Uncharacterized protein LOC101733901 n=1 Tax=Xenopus tropicalis TaxID=8364 RepID=A0A8J0SX81_XENTR|nr:uncharacterized protein LOC101733901 [Xenopus tropicalis]|eukprot:XP_017953152.1 PREDICTED: uncharacterized protein LOC101733901 [Xenopus tropicalis]
MSVASSENGNTPEQMIHRIVEFIYTRVKFDQGMDVWINDLKRNARADLNDIWATDGLVERYLTCMNLASNSSEKEKKLICALPPVLYALMEVDTLSKARKENVEKLMSQLHEIESDIQHMKSDKNQLEIDISNKEAFIRDLETDAERSRIAYCKLRKDFEELQQQHIKSQQSGVYGVERSPDPPIITPQYKHWAPYISRAKPIDNVDSEAQDVLGRLAEACQAVTTLIGNHRTRVLRDSSSDTSPERNVMNVRNQTPMSNVSHRSSVSNTDASEVESDERAWGSGPFPNRGKNTHKRGSKGKNPQSPKEKQNSASIIKFLNTAIPKFSKKGSSQIANHLELYESTIDSLKLSEADKIRFLPWAFDDRYRHYFSSFKERGITKWQSVLHEIKSEFGPYRTITAAKREIYKLTCRSNQSPREFLSVLKNAYGLAYRNPDWESVEFKQVFYEALPTQIKLSLAHDLDFENPLERLVTSATLLFNISEGQNLNDRKFKKFPEHNVDESRVKSHLNFESQPKKIPSATGPNQQNQKQLNPRQTKPQIAKGSEGNSSGSGSQDYRPRFNQGYQGYRGNQRYGGYQGYRGNQRYGGYQGYRDPQGYKRWNNRPRQQWRKGQESPDSPRGKSPTGNQNGPRNQNPGRPSRFDQLADQVSKLTDIVSKLSQVSAGKQPEVFLEVKAGPSSAK